MEKEFDASQHFLKMLRTGQFKVEKDGRVISEGVQMVLLPALTFAKICKDVPPKTLYEIGAYQAKKGVELHSKFFGLSIIKAVNFLLKGMMEKILEYALKSWIVDGYGLFKIEEFDIKEKRIVLSNSINPIARCYLRDFGKASAPIDYYFCGAFAGGMSEIFKRVATCKEIKCIACGDPACVFVIKW